MPTSKVILVLSQESSLDNFSCLALQLEREGVEVEFVWPWKPGPMQGSRFIATFNLSLYNPNWKLKTFRSYLSWRLYWLGNQRRTTMVFTQTPYLSDDYSNSTRKIFHRRQVGYLNYGLNVEKDTKYTMDISDFRGFKPLLLANPQEKEKFLKRGVSEANMLVTGMPGPYEVFRVANLSARAHQEPREPSLLWAPHWIDSWSTWENVAPKLVEFALDNPHFKIWIRAHPFLTAVTGKKLPAGYAEAPTRSQDSSKHLARLLSLLNVSVSRASMVEDCIRADCLLTDGISIVGYWATTGKPLAITRKASSPEFADSFSRILPNTIFIGTEDSRAVEDWLENVRTTLAQTPNNAKIETVKFIKSKMLFDEQKPPGRALYEYLS